MSGLDANFQSADLTKREKEVLELVVRGMSNKGIAAILHISEKTVETHLQHIYTKLAVKGRLETLMKYYKIREIPD